MNLREFESKELLSSVGIGVPRGMLAATPAEAAYHARDLSADVVVKAQVPTGGRGRAGGVKIVRDHRAVADAAQTILTRQIKGFPVREVLVEEVVPIVQELYVALLLDRDARSVTALLSTKGGMAVEDVIASCPDALARVRVPPLLGWRPFLGRQLCEQAGITGTLMRPLSDLFEQLWRLYVKSEATLIEINPLAATEDGGVVALDAKIVLDDAALALRGDTSVLSSQDLRDPLEKAAESSGFVYVKLDGNIGIVGNGAGLVMSTLDAVAAAGGRPADFLDLGGGATSERISAAFGVVLCDERLRAILVNVFGGITRCDEVARGLVQAMSSLDVGIPVIVRLDGTNAVKGRAVLASAGLAHLEVAETMPEAAAKAVAAAGA